jgi:hypothetical protein
MPRHLRSSASAARCSLGWLVVAGLVIVLAFTVGLQQPPPKPPEPVATTSKPPVPSADVNALPGGYDQMTPQLGEPRPGDLAAVSAGAGAAGTPANAAPRQLTPLEQYAQQAEMDRLRNEDRARGAAVSFANAGGGEASSGSQVSPGTGDDATQLQERLLELAQHGGGAPTAVPTAANGSTRDDPNRQEEKSEFADRTRDSDFQLHAAVEKPNHRTRSLPAQFCRA